MEQKREIELLVSKVLEKLDERGNSPNTILRHKRVYAQLIDYSSRHGNGNYSTELISCFLEERRIAAKGHGPHYMKQYDIALNKLADEAAGQEIRLNHRSYSPKLVSETFSWVLPEMKSRLEKRLKNPDSIRYRLLELNNFLLYLESVDIRSLADINIDHVAEGFHRSKDKGRFHSTVCEFLKISYKNGWIPSDLSYLVPQNRAHKPTPTVYSAEEIEQVLACIDASTASGKRKRAVFLIAARLGLRNSDICELQFSNIDWHKKMISLTQKKTGVPIMLPLLSDIEEALKAYIEIRPQSGLPYIFLRNKAPYLQLRNTTVIYELRLLFEQAGINTQGKRCSPHTLRSSLASSLLKEGVSYPIIQKTLGHSGPTATKYYAKIDIEKLRDCALEVPPPSGNFAKLLGGAKNA